MSIICDVNDYIFSPITNSRKTKFQKLLGTIQGGRVLDLGSGYAGFYWALGYIERVESLDFLDYFPENIEKLENMIDEVSPVYLEQHFGGTINFLQQEGMIQGDTSYSQIAKYFLEKVQNIQQFDFFDAIPCSYTTIFASEVIECVENEQEFEAVIQNIYTALLPGGYFIGNMLHYYSSNAITEKLIEHKQEGQLNSDKYMLEVYLRKVGFLEIQIEELESPRGIMICFWVKK